MPKLQNISADELAALVSMADDLTMTAHEINNRLEKNRLDDVDDLIARASDALLASQAIGRTAVLLLAAARLREGRRELDAMKAARAAGG